MTMSAPVFTFPISTQAFVISLIVRSEKRPDSDFPESKGRREAIKFFLPNSSIALRSSGCRITMIAIEAILTIFSAIHKIVSISKIAAISQNIAITITPFSSDHAFVFFTHTKILYTTKESMMISTMSVHLMSGIRLKYVSINS
jgi:hypothetical protein